jgi:AraC-like DNA-binding protein
MSVAPHASSVSCRDVVSFDGRHAVSASLAFRASPIPSRPARSGGIDLHRYVYPPPQAISALGTDEMHCELLKFANGNSAQMELSLARHLIILLPDGMPGGCEWYNGENAGKSRSMLPNTIIFNPAQNCLSLRARASRSPYRLLLLTIAPQAMDRLYRGSEDIAGVKFVQRIGLDDEDVRRTLLAFLREIESPGWNSQLYTEILITLLLSQLVRCASNLTRTKRIPYKKGGLPSWRLKRALELLEGDLCHAPSSVELARHLGLRPGSLFRAFKQSTGLPPHQYLLSHRINRAKEMMRDQNRTLTEVALDCGFSGSSQFSVAFKRIVGMPPREYRRSL